MFQNLGYTGIPDSGAKKTSLKTSSQTQGISKLKPKRKKTVNKHKHKNINQTNITNITNININ